MVLRWRWVTVAGFLLAGFLGCSGESSDPKKPGTGGSNAAEGGEAGFGADPVTSGKGGSAGKAGKGGTVGGTGGVGGATMVGGAGGLGARGGVGGASGSGGSSGSGVAGSGIVTVPIGWRCALDAYQDGVCDCGCGVADSDCKHEDRIKECERCSCASAECPGRVDAENTALCTPPPAGWSCVDSAYGDGKACDCGCGATDSDCEDESAASCDFCNPTGSCGHGACPSNIVEDDNAHCFQPEEWNCEPYRFGDGFCTCGCGYPDIDCASDKAAECTDCPYLGCSQGGCPGTLDPDDNTTCTTPPASWHCAVRLWNDGSQCDCGCGYLDPDCSGNDLDACDKCNDEGSCSGQACPGSINPDYIQGCTQPAPPDDWTCGSYSYGDGYACDCGCGVPDADCRTDNVAECEACHLCGSKCPDAIDPEDTTKCAPPPEGWLCAPANYRDDYCDCGCGVPDPACSGTDSNYCGRCDGCAHGHCERLEPEDNTQCKVKLPPEWTCGADTFYDGVCDCGCGAHDYDCLNVSKSSCDFCNTEGSCSDVLCSDESSTIKVLDNSSCME